MNPKGLETQIHPALCHRPCGRATVAARGGAPGQPQGRGRGPLPAAAPFAFRVGGTAGLWGAAHASFSFDPNIPGDASGTDAGGRAPATGGPHASGMGRAVVAFISSIDSSAVTFWIRTSAISDW